MQRFKQLCLCFALVSGAGVLPAVAATHCVSSSGGGGCYSRIGDAVAAAAPGDVIQVGPGTYREDVTVTRPLSLVAGNGVTIDATGLQRGIFVNGLGTPGLSGVHISGFTVKNANMEGILVLNATDVSVSGNTVMDNDRSLTASGCPNLPSFEPGEAMDCGEGIHLQAVDHSVVTNNTVTGNAGGGMLLSDDTGANHHNLLTFNTVKGNAGACGITLAAHAPATATANGVYKNTLYGNKSESNGTSLGGGAGIGLFVGAPGGATYDNVVVDNYVAGNGHPGVSMHAHAPGETLSDNLVVGNTVVGNGADSADAFTAGPTGIHVYSASALSTGNMIAGNSVQGEALDVVTNSPAPVQVEFNALLGLKTGLENSGAGTVDATENWWSCPSGPTMAGSCSMVVGNGVVDVPWLDTPIPAQPSY